MLKCWSSPCSTGNTPHQSAGENPDCNMMYFTHIDTPSRACILNTRQIQDRNQSNVYQPMILERRYSNVTRARPLVKISPSCSEDSIFKSWENSRNLLTLLPGPFYASLEFSSINLSHSKMRSSLCHTPIDYNHGSVHTVFGWVLPVTLIAKTPGIYHPCLSGF